MSNPFFKNNGPILVSEILKLLNIKYFDIQLNSKVNDIIVKLYNIQSFGALLLGRECYLSEAPKKTKYDRDNINITIL